VKAPDQQTNAVARALWYVAPGKTELREGAIVGPRSGEVLVRSLYSGLSRGTERLIYEGRVPASEFDRMRMPTQEGEFPFPVKYGYAAVGTVEAGPAELEGRTVFALHPHQDRFVVPADMVVPISEAVPARRAVLAANMETALNILWDGEAAPGLRIAIVGGGLVGLLSAALAAKLPGAEVTVIDIDPSRASLAQRLGATFARPEAAPHEADLVIHTSASDNGLALALDMTRFEGTVVEASWYGDRPVKVPLGGAFHSRRLRLVSSQVGAVAPSQRMRFTRRQRMEEALRSLADDRFDVLLGEEIPFAELPRHIPRLLAPDAPGVGALVRY
jgi:2-desacetyl-2-hydroxyethyl bacteriochlorophyllide A dehydrogenase